MEKFAIFDMDGTLTESMGVWKESYKLLLERYHFQPRPEVNESMNSTTPYEGAVMMVREYGLPLTPEELLAEIKALVAEGYSRAPLKPGVRRVLEELQARGVKMCIKSSTSQDLVLPMVQRLDIAKYFAFTDSCRDGHTKATPEPYLEAMEKLGAPDPGQVVVFEDAWHAVKNAKLGGFRVVAIEDSYAADHKAEIIETADQYITCWDEFVVE